MLKLTCVIQMYNSMFRIQDGTKEFSYVMGYAWKQLKMYFNCVSWFASIILNLNALCDVYRV